MQYRREVDGLRALAVIAIILFHAGFQTFGGGYVGVDVFFVISGYLITTVIVSQQRAGRFSLVDFYERRVRRILPALFVVLLTCLPFAWLWLTSEDLKIFSESLIAVSTFTSNFLFWHESGYFDSSAELKPLLHTWSLGVEEQFYLLFPPLMLVTVRLQRRRRQLVLVGLAVVSLALAQWGTISSPSAAFYLLPTRGFELLIGAILAFRSTSPGQFASGHGFSQWGDLIGLLLIAYAILVFDRQTPFPGLYALMPTVGAAFVIAFATPRTLVGKLLGSRLLVGIGLISYSAYLWHQPLFAFIRYRSAREPGNWQMAVLGLAVLGLAFISWKYVETPFRDRRRVTRKQVFLLGFIGSAFFIMTGLIGYFTHDAIQLRATEAQTAVLNTSTLSPRRGDCHTDGANYLRPVDACELNSGKLNWAVFGDSHAVELAYALGEKLSATGEKLKQLSFSQCAPSFGRTVPDQADMIDCAHWTQDAMEFLAKERRIGVVVVTYRIHAHLFGEHDGRFSLRHGAAVTDSEREQRWNSYINVLKYLVAQGKEVVLVLQAPEISDSFPKLLLKASNPTGNIVGMKRALWNERSEFLRKRLHEIPAGVVIVDPANLFCDATNCYAAKSGMAYYFDDNHMSVAGAGIVANEIVNQVARRHPR